MQRQEGFALATGRARSASVKNLRQPTHDNNHAAWLLWSAWSKLGLSALSAAALSVAIVPRRVLPFRPLDGLPARWTAETGWRLLGRFLAEFEQTFWASSQLTRVCPLAPGEDQSTHRPLAQIEYRPLPSASGARCALLKSGGLRVYAPQPTGADTFLLLAHEYAHAILALQAPGSMLDFVRTESHALAFERWAGRWLVHQTDLGVNPEDILGDLKEWWRGRRHVWTVCHQRLAVFEAELARASLQERPAPTSGELDDWWCFAHENGSCGSPTINQVSGGWAQCPALFTTPGRYHQSHHIWRQAIDMVRHPACWRASLFEAAFACDGAPLKPQTNVARPSPPSDHAKASSTCGQSATKLQPLNGGKNDREEKP